MKSKKDIYNFLNSHALAVISTMSLNEFPQAAVIGFGQTTELQLLFGTDITSRKYENLSKNKNVAFAIGWEKGETLQYEGKAKELKPGDIEIIRANYWKKTPSAEKQHSPSNRYFIVEPTWIRYTNLTVHPWDITELKF